MTNDGGFTFSVGDTTWTVYNQHRAGQLKLVALNTIFSVLYRTKVAQTTHTNFLEDTISVTHTDFLLNTLAWFENNCGSI